MTATRETAGSENRTRRNRRCRLRSLLAGIVILHSGAALAEADFHGIWVPAPELAEGWDRGSIAMTEQGAEAPGGEQ